MSVKNIFDRILGPLPKDTEVCIDAKTGFRTFRRKFRWLVTLWDGVYIANDATFVAVDGRPTIQPDIPGVDYESGFTVYNSPVKLKINDFNRADLKLLDACGNIVEEWVLHGCKIKERQEYEGFHNNTYYIRFSYQNVTYCSDFNPAFVSSVRENQVTIE